MQKKILEKSFKIIKAFSNSTNVAIIHLLYVFEEISTSQLSTYLNKSKPTILRHIKNLGELGIVGYFEDQNSPGKYAKRFFYLKTTDLSIRGQNLRKHVHSNTQIVIEYLNHVKSRYINTKQIIESAIAYIDKMQSEVSKVLHNPKEIIDIMKDNIGQLSLKYLDRESVRKIFMGTESHNNSEIKDQDVSSPKEYLQISALMPIRRIIEMNSTRHWKKEGTTWEFI